MLPEVVTQKLDALPGQSGVYVFRGEGHVVLYVGKARSLRSRVRSYFQPGTGDTRYFIPLLVDEIRDLETFVTATEKEAALLENHLIKEHKPRFNVKLRDDKEYLSLRLDPKAKWPRLEVVRRPRHDSASYFGPYHSATAARQTLRLVNRHFQLRTCTDADMASRARPCLQYQIARCPAPCVMEVDRAVYGEQVDAVSLFLRGRHDGLVDKLDRSMKTAAAAMEYERAAVVRDQIRAVERVREEQRVATSKDVDEDVLGMYREGEQVELAVLEVRGGRLVSVRTFDLDGMVMPDAEVVASFVSAFYGKDGAFVPDAILLPLAIEAMEGLAGALAEKRGGRAPEVLVPQRGAKVRLVEMAAENAAHAFREKARAKEDIDARLVQVQKRLRLPHVPHRIECIDVSHTGGQDTVAAIVALFDGQPDRKRYKTFHVRRVSGGDDYGAMHEVLSRRLKRGRDEEAQRTRAVSAARGPRTDTWELPDLLVVDGGRGQLAVATAVLRDLGVKGLPVVGLAKEKENVLGEKLVDRVYLVGQKNPVPLREGSSALYMLALARDEAHRASNLAREKLGKRRRMRSGLEDVAGVGEKTRKALLRALGSLKAVIAASADQLVAAGATRAQAKAIRAHFGETQAPPEALTVEGAAGAIAREGVPQPAAEPTEEAEEAAIDHAFVGTGSE